MATGAEESFRGPELSYDNRWVFRREREVAE